MSRDSLYITETWEALYSYFILLRNDQQLNPWTLWWGSNILHTRQHGNVLNFRLPGMWPAACLTNNQHDSAQLILYSFSGVIVVFICNWLSENIFSMGSSEIQLLENVSEIVGYFWKVRDLSLILMKTHHNKLKSHLVRKTWNSSFIFIEHY